MARIGCDSMGQLAIGFRCMCPAPRVAFDAVLRLDIRAEFRGPRTPRSAPYANPASVSVQHCARVGRPHANRIFFGMPPIGVPERERETVETAWRE